MSRKKKEVTVDDVNRKQYLKDKLIEHLKEVQPELNRKFDISKVVSRYGVKGSFRIYEPSFKQEDRYLYREILQELKSEGVLYHIGTNYWTRLK